jgi:hypothetical protein
MEILAMKITLIDTNHVEEKAYVEFESESVTANVSFTISDLNVLEDLIDSIRTILIEGKKDETSR